MNWEEYYPDELKILRAIKYLQDNTNYRSRFFNPNSPDNLGVLASLQVAVELHKCKQFIIDNKHLIPEDEIESLFELLI